MKQRSRVWRIGVSLFTFINVAGAAYAVALGQASHAAGHVGLLVLGGAGYAIWRNGRRSEPQDLAQLGPETEVLDRLQHSLDTIAVEVERIGEAQRFNAKILADRTQVRD